MSHYRDLLMTKFLKNPEDILNLSQENVERIREQSEVIDLAQINRAILEISKTVPIAKSSSQPRVLLEICMVKLATDSPDGEIIVRERRQKPLKEDEVPVASAKPEDRKERTEPSEERDQEGNLYGIWEAFLEDGEKTMGGMFGMVRNTAEPISLTSREISVKVSGMTKLFMEKNIPLMEDILEKYIGSRRVLKLIDEKEPKGGSEKKEMADIAGRAEDVLGIAVELK